MYIYLYNNLYINVWVIFMHKIKEENKYIFVSDKKEITDNFSIFSQSKYGSNSKIYCYHSNKLLKLFIDKATPTKMDFYDLIKNIKTKNIIKPDKFLIINGDFYGYSMNKANGKIIINVNPSIKYDDFIKSLLEIEQDIRNLSNKNISTNDINCLNILFDEHTKESVLVDIDNYSEEKTAPTELLTFNNLNWLYQTILYTIAIGQSINFNYDSKLFKYIMSLITNEFLFDKNIANNFTFIKNILEDIADKEIVSIKDFRKVLRHH